MPHRCAQSNKQYADTEKHTLRRTQIHPSIDWPTRQQRDQMKTIINGNKCYIYNNKTFFSRWGKLKLILSTLVFFLFIFHIHWSVAVQIRYISSRCRWWWWLFPLLLLIWSVSVLCCVCCWSAHTSLNNGYLILFLFSFRYDFARAGFWMNPKLRRGARRNTDIPSVGHNCSHCFTVFNFLISHWFFRCYV